MKAFWKVLGFAALAAGLAPYKVEKDEETGESSYQALLYRLTIGPGSGDDKKKIDVDLDEGTLTGKIMGAVGKKNEPHLFSDELSVEYAAPEAAEENKEETTEVVEEAAEAAGDAAETAEEAVAGTAEEAAEESAEPEEAQEPQAE